MIETILDKISQKPSEITQEDIQEWILPEVINHFESKFSSLSSYAYGISDTGRDIARKAFRELAIETLDKGLSSFILKKQHWRSGRKIQPYLITCLNRLADNIKKDVTSQSKISVPICPACKSLGNREFLRQEGKILRCHSCNIEQDLLEDRIKVSSLLDKGRLESELRLRKVFSMHSRKGYRCPDCSRFIPSSYTLNQNVSCPYDNHCGWFGHIDELEPMPHPLGLSSNNLISLNESITSSFEGGRNIEKQDLIKSNCINADVRIEASQNYENELTILKDVINTQYERVKNSPKGIKKAFMYEAFISMLDKNPEDMVSYLVKHIHGGDLPIQSRIFQEFIDIIQDSLPIKIIYQGSPVDIYSLQDPRLDLFTGLSEFESFVRPDGSIPNMTDEYYVGGRLMKHSNRCFIGKLIDIRAVDIDQSLLPFVEYYTFSQLKMSDDIPPGLKVKVKHFRIPAHYEMNGLVFLQRVRRRIADSVYLRIHGKHREINNGK